MVRRTVLATLIFPPGILGAAMIAWFIASLATPTKVKIAVGDSPDVIVAAYGGQLYVLVCDASWLRSRKIPWEEPWGLKPTVWEPQWGIGNDPWSATLWFAGSLPVLAIVPLLPMMMSLTWGAWRRRRQRGLRGFALESDQAVLTPLACRQRDG